jgi:hypothetical protein
VTGTDVGASGDFAAVLDNPLAGGDHQLQLRKFTGKDGKSSAFRRSRDRFPCRRTAMASQSARHGLQARHRQPHHHRAEGGTAADASNNATGDKLGCACAKLGRTGELALQTPNLTDAGSGAEPRHRPAPRTCRTDKTNAPDVMVNAVEIEGDKIFVAGTAKPSAKVFGYADDSLIGKAKAGPTAISSSTA